MRIEGTLCTRVIGPDDVMLDAQYRVAIEIPHSFPRLLPKAFELDAQIPREFHQFADGSLCLGSPMAQTLAIAAEPTIGRFLDLVLVPYLYAHAYFARFRKMPYGELAHGAAGLEQDARREFSLPENTRIDEFLRLAGMRRRQANKRPCPCGSRDRLGRCHTAAVREARQRLGRGWCREQYLQLLQLRAAERRQRGE